MNVRSDRHLSIVSRCTTQSTDTNAQICARFPCCMCRRIVELDGQNITCYEGLLTALQTCFLSPSSPLHMDSSLQTSRMSLVPDEVNNWRCRRDQYKRLFNETEKTWERQEQEELEEEHQKQQQRGHVEGSSNIKNKRLQQETLRRQLLHPAIKASLDSAAGKYGPLAPSSLSPWLDKRYAQLNTSRCWERRRCSHMTTDNKRRMAAQARLSPYFLCQYDWLNAPDSDIYMRKLWSMFHDGPVPPPCPSSHLTIQRSEFQSQQITNKTNTTPACTLISSSETFQTKTTRVTSPLLLPSAVAFSYSSSTSACPLPLSLRMENVKGGHDAVCFPTDCPLHTRSVSMSATVNDQFLHTPNMFNVLKIRAMLPHGAGRQNMTNITSVQKAKVATAGNSSLTTSTALSRQQPASFISRETFLVNFLRKMMRRVVHASRTDIPLCLRCWTDTLETQQKKAGYIMNDIVSLLALSDPPDVTSLALCYRTRRASSSILYKTHHIDLHITDNNNNNKLLHVGIDDNDVTRQESLKRLQLEVSEAEARLQLMVVACDVVHCELALLKTQEEVSNAEWEVATAINNAQQVVLFFAVEDAASGLSLRTQNAERSYAWLLRTHAMRLAFPIDTSGPVATIMGLRLGKCPLPPSSRRYSLSVRSRSAHVTKRHPSVFVAELNGSGEATALLNLLHIQQEYTRTFLGSREETVSVAEINHACGFLLLLLQHIIDRHHIPVQGSVFWPNGDQSRVEAVIMRGTPPRAVHRSADFFISENFFRWKTFGTACAIVTSTVWEIGQWMEKRLRDVRNTVEERLGAEETAQLTRSSSVFVVLESLGPTAPPYVITQDQVDGFPVRHGDVSEELWTLGMKKLLEIVQWCVFASRDIDNLQCLLGEL